MVGDLINIALGLCALVYSSTPADRVRNYNHTLALTMRFGGLLLIALGFINLLLRRLP